MGICDSTLNEQKANTNPKDKRHENTQETQVIQQNHIPGHAESESTFQYINNETNEKKRM